MTKKIAAVDKEMRNAGSIVMWRGRGEVSELQLREAWSKAGFDGSLLPQLPSPAEALARAVNSTRGRGQLARPLPKRDGWAFVAERPAGNNSDSLEHDTNFEVRLTIAGTLKFSGGTSQVAARVRDVYEHNLETLSVTDITAWLSGLVYRFAGTSLLDSGRVYFIPGTEKANWDAAMAVLSSVSETKVSDIPAVEVDSLVEWVMESIKEEAAQEFAAIQKDLDSDKPLGEDALRTRADRCRVMTAKLAQYEALLGVSLEQMRTDLEALNGSIAAATLACTADQENA